MRVLIIANPLVGIDREKRAILDDIIAKLAQRGTTADITFTMKPGMAKKRASRAVLEGYDAVYAAGGDGTINDVAAGLVDKNIPMGILPLGTGNGLARGLGIPIDRKGYTDTLLHHHLKKIDVGKISSRIFLATAGIGYDAYIAEDFNKQQVIARKTNKYFWYGFKNYFTKKPEKVDLVIDGKEYERHVFGLSVCNTTQYGSGAVIAPQANPESGTLIAVLIPKFDPIRAIGMVKKLFEGTVDKVKGLEYFEFTNMKIKRSAPGIVQVDGETFKADQTINVTVAHHALTIIIP